MFFRRLHFIIPTLMILMATASFARDYIIYSIVQDIPMGEPNEVLKKNFYINMGKKQGLENGVELDVFRTLYRANPYENNKRYSYKVKIGELKVLHSEDDVSITSFLNSPNGKEEAPLFELNSFMVGDEIKIKVDN